MTFGDVILDARLADALIRLNLHVPSDALEDAFRKLTTGPAATLLTNKVAFHRMLVNGIEVQCQRDDGSLGGVPARVIDFDHPENNDWLAVNQFVVKEDGHTRRADVVLFLNGLPVAVFELKNAADEAATIAGAFNQLQTYKAQIPSLFHHNATLVISDGLHARIGTISANRERFMPWRTIEGEDLASPALSELEVLLKGVFEPRRFLDLLRYCMVFEDEGDGPVKKMAGYHQWAALEAVVGAEKRVNLIAKDLVAHWDQRLDAMDGKALVVCMSRRICVDLYKAIVALRPEWHSPDDVQGTIKIVMTGSATDPFEWQQHIGGSKRRKDLAKRFKDPSGPLQIVIVRDMWLTGFDVPSLHTMYVDKPMRGHGLMQAIARVNRVFKDKPGGLVVDYLGLADELRHALATYTNSGGTGTTAIDQSEAVAVMRAKHEICCDMFHGFDRSAWTSGTPAQRMSLIPSGLQHILAQDQGKDRFTQIFIELAKAFALSVPDPAALAIRDDLGFFQAVNTGLKTLSRSGTKGKEEIDHAIRQLVSKAVAPGEVIDIFAAAGLKKPDISILSEEFLAEVRSLPHRNLALELLQKLLRDEIRLKRKRHLVQARSFAAMLEQAVRAYQNRALETAQVIDELIRAGEGDARG